MLQGLTLQGICYLYDLIESVVLDGFADCSDCICLKLHTQYIYSADVAASFPIQCTDPMSTTHSVPVRTGTVGNMLIVLFIQASHGAVQGAAQG
jgi:hypothetical protein